MRIGDMNWAMVERWLDDDDRCVLPLGSCEQHAGLSLAVDAILAEKVAVDAAAPSGVPVFPPMNYGLAPYFLAYPGTVSLRVETLLAVVRDVIASLRRTGFRRIVIVNGHGGNDPVRALAQELMAEAPGMQIKFHNWWNAPRTFAQVQAIDPVASHASWMENFPWTRLANVAATPGVKPMCDVDHLRTLDPERARAYLGDGNFGGAYQKPDEAMLALWDVAVAETRAVIETGWAP
ncbi:MAG: creatininase family protein [Geminicoccaceae bacterium]|nr:MAG: creatininase family protein [Geminicoccaceae bacterium]